MAEEIVTVDPSRRVIVFDFEHTLDREYWAGSIRNAVFLETDAKGHRLNEATANIWIEQPETLEQGLEMAVHLTEAAAFDLMIIDSIPSMLPKAIQERSMEEPTVGKHAAGLATWFQRMTGAISRNNVTVIMVNQYRANIGAGPYQKKTREPGGMAKNYYDSIHLELYGPKKTPWFPQGKTVNIKSVKNKVTGVDNETVQYHIGVGFGLSAEVELAEACERGKIATLDGEGPVVVMKGRTNEKRFPTRIAFLKALRENDKLFSGLTELCRINAVPIGMAPEEKKGGWGE
jgi:RecA/RadA recombinase